MRLLHDLRDRTGLTVVLVEQNTGKRALSITDHGFVLSQGAVVAGAAPPNCSRTTRMRHAYLGF